MRIEGDGFVLRPPRPEDAHAYAQAFVDDPDLVVQWGVDQAPDEATIAEWIREDAQKWRSGRGVAFTIADPADDAFLGSVNFHHHEPKHRRAEVGFWLVPGARTRGVGSAAVAAASRWAIERFGLERLEMQTLPSNEAALRLAARIGFRREGVMRGRNHERGEQVDIVMLAVLAREWHPRDAL